MLVLVDATACDVAGKVKVTLDAPPADLSALRLALCARLGLGGPDVAGVRVECWDGDFEEWTVLESLDDVRDKARLRLLPDTRAVTEPEPAASGVEARLMQRDGASEDVHSPVEGFQAARGARFLPRTTASYAHSTPSPARRDTLDSDVIGSASHTPPAHAAGGARGPHHLHGLRRVRAG